MGADLAGDGGGGGASEQVVQQGGQAGEQRQRPGGEQTGGESVRPVEGDVAQAQRPEAELSSVAALRGSSRGGEGNYGSSAAVEHGTSMLAVIAVEQRPERTQEEGSRAHEHEQGP